MAYTFGGKTYPTKEHRWLAQAVMVRELLKETDMSIQELAWTIQVYPQTIDNWLYDSPIMLEENFNKLQSIKKVEPKDYKDLRVSKYLIGNVLGEVADYKGWSLSYMSERLNRTEETVDRWIKGHAFPNRESLRSIEDLVKGPLEEMVA